MSIFFGIRGFNIGTDTLSYVNVFLGKSSLVIEPCFVILALIINFFTDEPQYFLLIINLLINSIMLVALRNFTKNYSLVLSIFYSTMLFINMNINILRQALAISLAFLAISYLIKGRQKKFFYIILIAIMTHYTAIIFVAAYFIINIKFSKRNVVFFVLSCFGFYFITVSDLLYFLKDYSDTINRLYWYFNWGISSPWQIKHVYYLFFLMIFMYALKGYKYLGENNLKVLKIIFFGLILILLFREEEMVADRIFYYFFALGTLLIVQIKNIVKQKNLYYLILYISVNLWVVKTTVLQYPNWFLE
tara:strand:+ start:1830 stop:2741 length:912 start_codon:yes stop_codon:yes gene_type:complete